MSHESRCLPQIIEEEYMFQDFKLKKGGWVTFRSNEKGKIVGIRKIGKHPFLSINNVLYVKGLKYNLLSISQLCDSMYDFSFNKGECIIKDCKGSIIFSSKRHNNLYKINLINLTKKIKQIRGSFESINVVSTSTPLELLHIIFLGLPELLHYVESIMDC
ncbi:hypothetical protein CR513_19480, partial [Mucuna pruriens]